MERRMVDGPADGKSQAAPEKGIRRMLPALVVAVMIVAMVIVGALGMGGTKVDQNAANGIAWNSDDHLNYTGASTIGNSTSEVGVDCFFPSTDINDPGFMVCSFWGIGDGATVLAGKQPIPYDLRSDRGAIVGQKQIATAFGEKWVNVWTSQVRYENATASKMAIVTASVGQSTGLVYEASMMTEDLQVHICVSNSTNAQMQGADLEQKGIILCKGAKVTTDGCGFTSEAGISSSGFCPVAIREGEALHFEVHGNNTFMRVLSVQDLFGIASGNFSFDQNLSLLTGISGTVNKCPATGVYYTYLEIRSSAEDTSVAMYWSSDE
jgi:hypothetical protein